LFGEAQPDAFHVGLAAVLDVARDLLGPNGLFADSLRRVDE
jgi:hypothetical protein